MAHLKIKVGLYGTNGHQIIPELQNNPNVLLIATSEVNAKVLSVLQHQNINLKQYDSLDDLLRDVQIQLVSLCSPKRSEQAQHAVKSLRAGKHVYAEKPCALTEDSLDEIIQTSLETGMQFHEMAGTAFDQPYLAMRDIVKSGVIGEVVQVFAQKSYPFYDERPQDEDVDGGLLCQVGIHAVRFIEQVAGQKIIDISSLETKIGNPETQGNLHMAATCMMTLENGGIASLIANYLNPKGFGTWGNESLRIFGTAGLVEAVDGGTRTRLIIGDKDMGSIEMMRDGLNYFDEFIKSLLGKGSMPISLEEELHATRMVIRAKKS